MEVLAAFSNKFVLQYGEKPRKGSSTCVRLNNFDTYVPYQTIKTDETSKAERANKEINIQLDFAWNYKGPFRA